MHKLLARQLKRALEVDPASLESLQGELEALAASGNLSAGAAKLVRGLPVFFQRVDEAYQQSDRDLER